MKQSSKPLHQFTPLMRNGHLRADGFVLVAVLLLIALAVVLVVTTSSVSQTERKAVSNSANQELARQNALFALNLAVSQLQVAAGPDQRVTATADILNTNNANPSPVVQPYWTGVWKSYKSSYSPSPWFRPQPFDTDTNGSAGTTTTALRPWSTQSTNVTWLVSGATNNTLISPTNASSTWPVSLSNIVLASNWGTGTNGSITGGTWTNSTTVSVPLVMISNSMTVSGKTANYYTGKYAYWVSDEGVKAKVSLQDTNLSTALISVMPNWVPGLLHFLAPPATMASSVMTNLGISTVLTTDFRSNTNLTKLTSLGGLALITTNVPVFTNNTLAADLTVYSYGVLSDTRRGGLKQDLTAAFESTRNSSPANFLTLQARSGIGSGNDACSIYRIPNIAIAPSGVASAAINLVFTNGETTTFYGPRWISLYNFYNLYKTSQPTNATAYVSPANTNIPSGIGGTNNGGTNLTASSYNTLESRSSFWLETNTMSVASSNQFSVLPLVPTQIADRIDCVLTAYVTTIGTPPTNNYNFQIQYYPLLILHNPYSVALTFSNTASFQISKDVFGSTTVTLGLTTNGAAISVTNEPYQVWESSKISPNYNKPIATNPYTGTNLWPADYVNNNEANWATTPNFHPFGGTTYPMMQGCTNLVILQPGEVRAFAPTLPLTTTTMASAAAFPTMVSSNTATPGTYQAINLPVIANGGSGFAGTTNSNAIVSLSVANANTSYGICRWYPAAGFNVWPNSVVGAYYSYAYSTPLVLQPTSANNLTMGTLPPGLTIRQLVGNSYRVVGIFERLKGIISDGDPSYLNASSNIPVMMGNAQQYNAGRSGFAFQGLTSISTEVWGNGVTNMGTFTNASTIAVGTKLFSTWGALAAGSPNSSYPFSNPQKLVLRDIPIAPLTSLGQLQHFEDWNFNKSYFNYMFPAMSVGGSFANPEVASNATSMAYNATLGTLQSSPSTYQYINNDYSYLANEALFDTYFFSTVPPASGFANWNGTTGYGAFTNQLTDLIAQHAPLANARHILYYKNGSNPAVADLQDESKAAANILLDGAFNINSTSVSAWKSLLASLAGQNFHTYNYNAVSGQNYTPPSGQYPIPRFWSVSYTNTPNVPWEGLRTLNDTQLTALATEIVKQVRLRGPFLSMGDFLNRKLGATLNQTNTMGALQAAIENTQTNGTSSDVNDCIHSIFHQAVNVAGVKSIATNTAVGIPGYLMQQDIVQAFAPVMTARSDTFIIRVYGESDKPSTSTAVTTTYSQAWGEAVVQRLPEYFEQTDPALTSPPAGMSGVTYALGDATPPVTSSGSFISTSNQKFGRRFKIISFRWLNQNEL